MAKEIIHGIGKLIMRDFREPKTIIGFTDLQDLSVESTSSKDDITGGNKMFPIASFKQDQALTISGTNATFNEGLLEYMDGADKTVAAVNMTDALEVRVPEDGIVNLSNTPIAGSVVVNGFTVVDTGDPVAGEVLSTAATTELKFATADAGTGITIVYEYLASNKAVEYSVTQKSMSKPFIAEYIFPIYDEDTQITANAMLKIYKAQCTSGFTISPSHQSAFAPTFEAEAKDAQRVDGKLWSLFIDGVAV
jgi:hypothetical protein